MEDIQILNLPGFMGGQSELAIFSAFFWQFFSGFHLASFACVWHPIHVENRCPQNGAIQQAVARLLCNMVVDSQNRVPYSKQECAKMVQYNRVWLDEGATWL